MDYEDMSDFEVNKIVAMAESLIINDDQSMSKRMKGSEVRVNDIVSSWWFDPCNNPSDAWPLLLKLTESGCTIVIEKESVNGELLNGKSITRKVAELYLSFNSD